MVCDQDIRVLVSSYADGQVTPEEERRARRHLEECPDCRARVEEWRRLGEVFEWAYTMDLPEVDVMESLTDTRPEHPAGRLAERLAGLRVRIGGRRTWTLAAAGTATIAATVAVSFALHQRSLPPMLAAGLRTGASGQVVRMEHGVRLEVAPHSAIARLGTDVVRLESGSVRATVEHGARRFRVRSPRFEVTDLGTRFRVGTGQGSDAVVVEEGSVSVRCGARRQTLSAGQALVARDGRAPVAFSVPALPDSAPDGSVPLYDPSVSFAPDTWSGLEWRDRAKRLAARFPDARRTNDRISTDSPWNGRAYGCSRDAAPGLRAGLREHFADLALAVAGAPTLAEWEVPVGYLLVDGVAAPVSLPADMYYIRLRSEGGRLAWRLSSATADTDVPVTFAPEDRAEGGDAFGASGALRAFSQISYLGNGQRTDRITLLAGNGPVTPSLSLTIAGVSLAERDPAAQAMLRQVYRRYDIGLWDLSKFSVETLYLDPQRKHRLLLLWNPKAAEEMDRARKPRGLWAFLGIVMADVPWQDPSWPGSADVPFELIWHQPWGTGQKPRFGITLPERNALPDDLPEKPSVGPRRSTNPGKGEFGSAMQPVGPAGADPRSEMTLQFQSMGAAGGVYRFRLLMGTNDGPEDDARFGEGWFSLQRP